MNLPKLLASKLNDKKFNPLASSSGSDFCFLENSKCKLAGLDGGLSHPGRVQSWHDAVPSWTPKFHTVRRVWEDK